MDEATPYEAVRADLRDKRLALEDFIRHGGNPRQIATIEMELGVWPVTVLNE